MIRYQFKTRDDVTLNAVETGNPLGQAILFVHGLSQSWRSWMAQFADPQLRGRFRFVPLDSLPPHRTFVRQPAAERRPERLCRLSNPNRIWPPRMDSNLNITSRERRFNPQGTHSEPLTILPSFLIQLWSGAFDHSKPL
jgi:pimeloyl-ACP methyl ester carboxylesterase